MSTSGTNFYEILGIDPNASPEDIRRAYKKKALRTHPDRLPQGATTAEREAANEHFRKVNNAYQILMDTKNRKLYDLYGVWPPPEEPLEEPKPHRGHNPGYTSHRPYPQSNPFFDPFFNPPPFADPFTRHRSTPRFAFRDPFELFDAIFNMQRDFHQTIAPMNLNQFVDPFGHRASSGFNGSHAPPHFPPLSPFLQTPSLFPGTTFTDDDGGRWESGPSRPSGMQSHSFQSSYRGQCASGPNGQQPQWISESTMTRSINGITETIHKRIDHQGNEHVTKIYPNGRKKYTVNGVEQPQPSSGHIQGASAHGRLPPTNFNSNLTAPIIPPDPEQGSSKKRWWGRG